MDHKKERIVILASTYTYPVLSGAKRSSAERPINSISFVHTSPFPVLASLAGTSIVFLSFRDWCVHMCATVLTFFLFSMAARCGRVQYFVGYVDNGRRRLRQTVNLQFQLIIYVL